MATTAAAATAPPGASTRRSSQAGRVEMFSSAACRACVSFDRVAASFTTPAGVVPTSESPAGDDSPAFTRWLARNVRGHRVAGYRAVTLSLKRAGQAPGDATDAQLDAAADLADRYSHGELRVTHDQNLLLPWVREGDLLWTPSPDRVAGARLTEFTRFAEERIGRRFADYAQLWAWSTTELDEFWQAVWDFFHPPAGAPAPAVAEEGGPTEADIDSALASEAEGDGGEGGAPHPGYVPPARQGGGGTP